MVYIDKIFEIGNTLNSFASLDDSDLIGDLNY